jgi:hypothetical protein
MERKVVRGCRCRRGCRCVGYLSKAGLSFFFKSLFHLLHSWSSISADYKISFPGAFTSLVLDLFSLSFFVLSIYIALKPYFFFFFLSFPLLFPLSSPFIRRPFFFSFLRPISTTSCLPGVNVILLSLLSRPSLFHTHTSDL